MNHDTLRTARQRVVVEALEMLLLARAASGTGLSPAAEPASQSHRLRRFDPIAREGV